MCCSNNKYSFIFYFNWNVIFLTCQCSLQFIFNSLAHYHPNGTPMYVIRFRLGFKGSSSYKDPFREFRSEQFNWT